MKKQQTDIQLNKMLILLWEKDFLIWNLQMLIIYMYVYFSEYKSEQDRVIFWNLLNYGQQFFSSDM